ncbi:MAG TPA: hypothetical protein VNF99_10680 [Stellaceae bacterium]|nr:hypothetical protein [Stellaceae bacterium]
MRPRFFTLAVMLGLILAFSTGEANAYVGPGAGLSAIGSLVSVISALMLAVAGFVWYPIKRLLRLGKAAATKSAGGRQSRPGARPGAAPGAAPE